MQSVASRLLQYLNETTPESRTPACRLNLRIWLAKRTVLSALNPPDKALVLCVDEKSQIQMSLPMPMFRICSFPRNVAIRPQQASDPLRSRSPESLYEDSRRYRYHHACPRR